MSRLDTALTVANLVKLASDIFDAHRARKKADDRDKRIADLEARLAKMEAGQEKPQ